MSLKRSGIKSIKHKVYLIRNEILALRFPFESTLLQILGVEVVIDPIRLVSRHISLRIGERTAVYFSDMSGRGKQIHLDLLLVVPVKVRIGLPYCVRGLPIVPHAVPEIVLRCSRWCPTPRKLRVG